MQNKIAIFASGSGSNMENIYSYFSKKKTAIITCVCTNKKNAFVVTRAKKLNIPLIIFTKYDLNSFDVLHKKLKKFQVDYIVLAGFLLKIPPIMVNKYKNCIINIHPSLLPKYGGKGMYGDNVLKTVLENKETESGVSIHFVNKFYDKGEIILQEKCAISENENILTLADKIRRLEHRYFPVAIEMVLKKNIL
tara:strand:- start:694 stop:1272 length:579 start_codon:yes stop_codon:yes gene_type:complete